MSDLDGIVVSLSTKMCSVQGGTVSKPNRGEMVEAMVNLATNGVVRKCAGQSNRISLNMFRTVQSARRETTMSARRTGRQLL
jgi:hypothetical protein